MTTQHTPGPWTAQPGDNFITDERDIVICEMHRHHPDEQVNANARLIAAAPELLEALRDFVAAANGVHAEPLTWLAKARAAIDKAIGEEK